MLITTVNLGQTFQAPNVMVLKVSITQVKIFTIYENLMCGAQTNFQFVLTNCGKWIFLSIRIASMSLDFNRNLEKWSNSYVTVKNSFSHFIDNELLYWLP